jgi:hypothetical protein
MREKLSVKLKSIDYTFSIHFSAFVHVFVVSVDK